MISVAVQYSTSDFRFLKANLTQVSKFSDEIIVTICDHFYTGEPEDSKLLEQSIDIINTFEKCKLEIIKWDGVKQSPAYYHNLSRKTALDLTTNDWILFLDADEIVDDNFKDWFTVNAYKHNCYNFTCYWYFREPIYQALTTESAGVLIRREDCQDWDLNSKLELKQFYQALWEQDRLSHGDEESNPVVGLDGRVMVHHYSWVRSKEEMLKKVRNWGHRNDTPGANLHIGESKSWIQLVEEEFSREFNKTDFIHGYSYVEVKNKFNL